MPAERAPHRLLLERLEDRILLSAAIPVAAVDIPTEEFINEDFNFSIDFDNAGAAGNVGFAPFIDVIVPADIDLSGASISYLGTAIAPVLTATYDGTQWLDGTEPVLLHPLTNLALTPGATAGDQLIVVQLPFGSFTPDQPIAEIEFTGANLGGTVGTPINVIASAGFAFGCDELDNPLTDAPIVQAPVTMSITPTVIELTKINHAAESETVTGANFPVSFTLEIDIATGETIDSLVLTDALPPGVTFLNNIVFDLGATPTIGALPIELTYGSVTGVDGADIRVTYSYFLPDLISDSDGGSNDDTDFTNMAAVNGLHVGNAVGDTDQNTVTGKLIAIQKGVQLINDVDLNGGVSAGDSLEYTLNFQISDFTDFSNIVIDDLLGDGLVFDATFTPTYSVIEQGLSTPLSNFNVANFSLTPDLLEGTTLIQFLLSDELDARVAPPVQDGVLMGDIGSQDPLNPRGTTGTVTFRATILEDFISPDGPDMDASVDIGDTLPNNVTISGTTAGGDDESDTSSAAVTIDGLSLDKTIYAIDGDTNIAPLLAAGLFPGQEVTYRIKVTLPSADTENLVLTDFLPLPVFDVDDIDGASGANNNLTFINTFTPGAGGGAAAPAAGFAKYGPDHTLHENETAAWNFTTSSPLDPPTITTDGPSNRIDFDFGTFDATPSGTVTLDILFTVQLLDKPFGDGLFLTNQSVSTFGDTDGMTVSNTEIVQIALNQPNLSVTKGVVATDNPDGQFDIVVGPVTFNPPGAANPFSGTFNSAALAANPIDANLIGIDAGDIVTFAIVIENTGGADAFDILLNDVIPAGFEIVTGTTFADANGQVRLASDPNTAIGFSEIGSFFSGVDGQGIRINDPALNDGALDDRNGPAGDNILVITYELRAIAAVNPATFHANTAHLDEFSAIEGGVDYTDGFEEDRYTDTANVITADPEIAKSFVTTDRSFTDGSDVAFGEVVTYDLLITLPEGEITDLNITELLPPGLAYTGAASIITLAAGSSLASNFAGSVELVGVPAAAAAGTDITFSLQRVGGGTVLTTADNIANNNSFILRFDAVLDGSVVSVNGGDRVPNSAQLDYTDSDGIDNSGTPSPATPIASNIVNIDVVEPDLQITKNIDLDTIDAGDVVTVSLTLDNIGNSDAFEVVIRDVVDPLKFTNVTLVSTPIGFTSAFSLVGPDANTVVYTSLPGTALAEGSSFTFTFTAEATAGITPGERITNIAQITNGVTLPNGVPGVDPSRDLPIKMDSDFVDVVLGLDKSLVATSEGHTLGTDLAIGEIARYRLVIEFPETGTTDLQIVDRLPNGMTFLNDGTATIALVSNAGGFISPTGVPFNPALATITGSNAAGVIPTFVLGDDNVSAAPEVNDDVYVNGGDVFFRLGDLNNIDRDADSEFIVIEFNAFVGNVASNNQGTNLANDFIVTSDDGGANQQIGLDSNAVIAAIQEPIIALNKVITTAANDAGDTIVYNINVTNTGGATGFEIQVTDDLDGLDSGVFTLVSAVFNALGSGAVVIDNTNIATNLVDMTIDSLGAGESATITVTASLANDLIAGRELSNQADGFYSGLPGTGTPVGPGNPTGSSIPGGSGATDGERDASGGINDYAVRSTVSFTVPSPAVDKELFDLDTTFAVGESIFYDILITLPEGITQSLVVTDQIPVGLAVVGAQLITTSGTPATPLDPVSSRLTGNFLGTITNPAVLSIGLGDGVDFVHNFGDVATNASAATANNQFVLRVEAVILDTGLSGLGAGAPTFTNNAQVTYLDPDDGAGGIPATTMVDDPTDPVITLVEPQLSIDKSVVVNGSGTSGDAGDATVYTIVVRHTGISTADAFDLDLGDTLPDEFSPASFTATTAVLGDVSARFNLVGLNFTTIGDLDLALNDTLTITFTGALNDTITPGGMPVANTINGSYTTADGDQIDKTGAANPNDDEVTRNLSDDASIDIPAPSFEKVIIGSDQALTSDVLGELTIGETVTFGIVLTLPEGTYGEIVISDDIPIGLEYVLASASVLLPPGYAGVPPTVSVAGGVGSGSDITLTLSAPFTVLGDGNGANNQLTIVYGAIALDVPGTSGFVPGPTTFTNTASVTLDDPDNPGTPLDVDVTGQPPGTTLDSEVLSAVEPELVITKSSTTTQADAGDTVTYTITLSHSAQSGGPAYDIALTDLLMTADDELDLVVGSVTTTAGTVTTGNTAGDTTIRIDIATFDRPDPLITITYQAMLNGNVTVTGDTLTNTAVVDYDSFGGVSAEERTSTDNSPYDLNVPLTTIQFDKAIVATSLAHTGSGQLDPALTDLVVGEIVTYRLVATLPAGIYPDLVDFTISDNLPDYLALVAPPRIMLGADIIDNSVTTAPFSNDGFTVTFDVANVLLNPGLIADQQIVVEYDALVLPSNGVTDNFNGNVLTNSAEFLFGVTPFNASVDVEVVEPELVVTKTASNTTPNFGDVITYTIVVEHVPSPGAPAGSGFNAYDLVISDALHPNLSLIAASVMVNDSPIGAASGLTLSTTGGVLTVRADSLELVSAPQGSITITYMAEVTTDVDLFGGDINNTVQVSYDGAPGDIPGQKVETTDASETVTIIGPDLTVTKTDLVATSNPGDVLTYTIEVTNKAGPNADLATNIEVLDRIPAGTTFVNSPDATFDGVIGDEARWLIPNIAIGATVTLTLEIRVDDPLGPGIENIQNSVVVNNLDDIDPTPSDNVASDTTAVDAGPDLVISKNDGLNVVNPGQSITYTIEATNTGNQSASGVVVTDAFPTGFLMDVSASTPVGVSGVVINESTGTITWTLGQLDVGETIVLMVNANVSSSIPAGATQYTNSVSISDDGASGPDRNPGDELASDTNELDPVTTVPDYAIAKTNNTDKISPSDTTVYTITVSNIGGQVGTNVVVTDTFDPAFFATVSASDGGVVDLQAGTITWTLASLAGSGGSVDLTVQATLKQVTPAGFDTLTNSVFVTDDGANGADPDPSNNSASDTDELEVFVFDGLRNDAFFGDEGRGNDPFARLNDIDHELDVPPIDAIFTGHSEPGTTLIITLLDENGASIGFQTVMADSGGNWVANFGGTVLTHQPQSITIEQEASLIDDSTDGGFNLRTYFSPATSSPLFFTYVPNQDSAFAGSASNILFATESADNAPIAVGWNKSSSYEFLTSSTTTTQFMN